MLKKRSKFNFNKTKRGVIMKYLTKCFMAVLMVCAASFTVYADDAKNMYDKGNIFFGGKYGMGFSGYKYDHIVSKIWSSGTGDVTILEQRSAFAMVYSFGLDFGYFFRDNIAFVAELNLELSMYDYSYVWTIVETEEYDKYIIPFYITTPVGIHYFFAETFFIGGGLYYASLLNSEEHAESHLGIFVDAGIGRKLNNNIMRVFLRYQHGFDNAKTWTATGCISYGWLF